MEVQTIIEALQRSTHDPVNGAAVLLDMGANVGAFSFVAAVLGYQVYSFEAMPRNVLHQTLQLRNRMTARCHLRNLYTFHLKAVVGCVCVASC